MLVIRFEWDEKKNKANRKKHGIWFEEALQIFDDPEGIRYYDSEHSEEEDRFILIGRTLFGRLLVVVFCERKQIIVRIISARRATSKELKVYEKGI